MKKHRTRKPRSPEGKKISHLVREEGKHPKQAVAIALSMKRAGRLSPSGSYRRVSKKKSRRRSHKS